MKPVMIKMSHEESVKLLERQNAGWLARLRYSGDPPVDVRAVRAFAVGFGAKVKVGSAGGQMGRVMAPWVCTRCDSHVFEPLVLVTYSGFDGAVLVRGLLLLGFRSADIDEFYNDPDLLVAWRYRCAECHSSGNAYYEIF